MLLNHIAAAPASLPPTEMDRIEALRWQLQRLESLAASGIVNNGGVPTITMIHEIVANALKADDQRAATQDAAQAAVAQGPVYGWQPGQGFIRELPERRANFMEPLL